MVKSKPLALLIMGIVFGVSFQKWGQKWVQKWTESSGPKTGESLSAAPSPTPSLIPSPEGAPQLPNWANPIPLRETHLHFIDLFIESLDSHDEDVVLSFFSKALREKTRVIDKMSPSHFVKSVLLSESFRAGISNPETRKIRSILDSAFSITIEFESDHSSEPDASEPVTARLELRFQQIEGNFKLTEVLGSV